MGKQTLRGQKQKCVHQDPGEKSSDVKETEPDSPVSIPKALVKVSVESDQLQGQGH